MIPPYKPFEYRKMSDLETNFRLSLNFFREKTNYSFDETRRSPIREGTLTNLFIFGEVIKFRSYLETIQKEQGRRDRNEILITEKMQEFVNEIGIKIQIWNELKIYLDDHNDIQELLDQNTPVVQI